MFNFFRLSYDEFGYAANDTYAFLDANYGRLGMPSPKKAIFAPLTAFNNACDAVKAGGAATSAERREARKTLEKAFRGYGYEHLFHNPRLTAADKAMAHLHNAKKTRTEVSVPDTIQLVLVITAIVRELSFMYWGHGMKRAGKPRKVGFFVLRWALLDHDPASIAELINVTESSKPPLTLRFDESDRGKRLYFVVSWRIARGALEGPTSDIMMAIVP
jgi:hypothetical protein